MTCERSNSRALRAGAAGLYPVGPVERPPPLVMHREHVDRVVRRALHDDVGEPWRRERPSEHVPGVSGANRCTCVRPGGGAVRRRNDCAEEPITEASNGCSYHSSASTSSAVASGWNRMRSLTDRCETERPSAVLRPRNPSRPARRRSAQRGERSPRPRRDQARHCPPRPGGRRGCPAGR